MSFNGSYVNFYINGQKISAAQAGNITIVNLPLFIGNVYVIGADKSEPFTGSIAHVRIYNETATD